MGRKRRWNPNLHTCECCGVNDENIDTYSCEDGDYYDYTGVKYYGNVDEEDDVDEEDLADEYPPENLYDGWYCNICIARKSSEFWKEESTAYMYDNNGIPYGEEGYGDDY